MVVKLWQYHTRNAAIHCKLSFFVSQVSNEPGNRYNIQLINALVLYVGTQAIAHIHNKGSTPSMSTITHSAHMDIFQNLAVDLDTEGKICSTVSKVVCSTSNYICCSGFILG